MGLGELFVVFLMVMSMIAYFRIFHSKCLICFYVQIYSLFKRLLVNLLAGIVILV